MAVNVSEPKNFKLLKKLVLQVIICTIIYYIFYLISTTNYSFSEGTLSKTEELISNDFDFYSVYSSFVNWANSYIYGNENKEENKNEEDKQENISADVVEQNAANTENIIPPEEVPNEDESLTQNEISKAEVSETERIKAKYAFLKPAERRNLIGIWDKRSYSRCCNSIS